MLKNVLRVLIGFLLTTAVFAASPLTLIIDALNQPGLPHDFHSTATFSTTEQAVNTTSLSNLHVISSAQFSEAGLLMVMEQIKAPIWVVDLRQEAHGFLDGTAVSWYSKRDWANLGKTPEQVEIEQQKLLLNLGDQETLTLNKMLHEDRPDEIIRIKPIEFDVDTAVSEFELTKSYQLGYTRLYVIRGMVPKDAQIDRFITLVRNLPVSTWLYFHGRTGEDRSVLFMALYDMMRNAKQVSFDDIIKRQSLLSGVDLLDVQNTKYKNTYEAQRLAILSKFYQYCQTNVDNFATSWSVWNGKVVK